MSVGADITRTLTRYALPRSSNEALAAAVASALEGCSWRVRRDAEPSGYRVPVLVELPDRGVAVCVTTSRRVERGQAHDRLRAIATSDDVAELVLVTTKSSHLTLPESVGGKPLAVHLVRR